MAATKAPSTVGRGKALTLRGAPDLDHYRDDSVNVRLGDSLDAYADWPAPDVIVSDGAYGILGFEGDTSDHLGVPAWYEPHVNVWSERALPSTTLWFWNSEIGWAATHPVLERCGWRYVSCNVWNKGKGHIAGNVRTATIRRFPVVTEVCVQYVRAAEVKGVPLRRWLRSEWQRSGLALRLANEACGVKDAATRKYFDQGHLWYFPPPEAFEKLARYANEHGMPDGRPYFSFDGERSVSASEWARQRATFRCPHGYTNVWDRPPVRSPERIRVKGKRAAHLNQKPLDLMRLTLAASCDERGAVWEPFGGLFSACVAARSLGMRAYAAEIDTTYFQLGLQRLLSDADG